MVGGGGTGGDSSPDSVSLVRWCKGTIFINFPYMFVHESLIVILDIIKSYNLLSFGVYYRSFQFITVVHVFRKVMNLFDLFKILKP